MMLSFVCFSRIYIIPEKEIKMPELETLFVLMNAVLHEYGPRFCLYEYGPQKWAIPHSKEFLRKSLNFRPKVENFEHLELKKRVS